MVHILFQQKPDAAGGAAAAAAAPHPSGGGGAPRGSVYMTAKPSSMRGGTMAIADRMTRSNVGAIYGQMIDKEKKSMFLMHDDDEWWWW